MVPRRQLANANSIGLVSTYATLPLGGAVFAVLAAFSSWAGGRVPFLGDRPESLALLLDAGTFAFSAFMVSRIDFPAPVRGLKGRFDLSRVWRDVVDGVRFLREDSIASAMTGGIVIAFAAVGAVMALGPIFVSTLDADAAAFGVVVTAFGIGMFLGMATADRTQQVRRARRGVRVGPARGGGHPLRARGDAEPRARGGRLGVARCILRTRVGQRLHLASGERRGRLRGRTFASLTTLSRLGLFLSLTVFPILSSVYVDYDFFVGGQRFDLSAPRQAMWTAGVLAMVAGLNTRRLLKRYRLSRPEPLALVPKLKRPPATGLFIAFEGVEGAGKGTQIRLAEEYLRDRSFDVLVTREPGGTELGEKVRGILWIRGRGSSTRDPKPCCSRHPAHRRSRP